jgi:serine/threonine-protein kinase
VKECPTCRQRFSRDGRFCPFHGDKLQPATGDLIADPLFGSTVDGRYEILDLLGEGGTGRVYKVRHTALDRLFAMKILRSDLARDEELASRFIQEAKAIASVRHPNVVEITDFGELPDGVPYFVTELLIGRTLGDIIRADGPMAPARVSRIVEQIAGALGAAHAVGIVHRDLKPDNVFLIDPDRNGGLADDVRIVDFGAAKVIGASRVTREGIVFGTPHYMSPEQASGQPVDHRTDVYSLGVIVYEMLTGRVPFEADTYMGVLSQHMFVLPVPPSQRLSPGRSLGELEDITLVCLAKRAEARYQSMDRLVSAVGYAGRAGPPGSARKHASGKDPLARPRARLGWVWVVGLVAVLAGLAFLWARVGRNPAPAFETRTGVARETLEAASRASARASAVEPSRTTSSAPPGATTSLTVPPGSRSNAKSPSPEAPDGGALGARPPPRSTAEGARRSRPSSPAPSIDDVGDPFPARK